MERDKVFGDDNFRMAKETRLTLCGISDDNSMTNLCSPYTDTAISLVPQCRACLESCLSNSPVHSVGSTSKN